MIFKTDCRRKYYETAMNYSLQTSYVQSGAQAKVLYGPV